MSAWRALKRPLFLAFFLGCTVSFLTAGTLTLRLIVPEMVAWAIVPLIEMAALAVVCRGDQRNIRFAELIDSFFRGYLPWLLWLIGICVIWSLLSPASNSLDWTISIVWMLGGVGCAVVWSLFIDFRFFKSVLKRNPAVAMRDVAMHRFISWTLILAVIGGPTIWSDITGRLW
jgi:hypothetical protein